MRVLLVLLLAGLLIVAACASPARLHEAKRKHKDGDAARNRPDANEKNQPSIEDAAVADDDDDDDDDVDDVDDVDDDVSKTNPCWEHHCHEGKECTLNEMDEPYCRCARSCVKSNDPRTEVCSSHNITYATECHLYKQRCLCETGDVGCHDKRNVHEHTEYRGKCIYLKPCLPQEMEVFPHRMKEWLFNVMKTRNERNDLGEEYIPLEKEAERKSEMKLVNPVIWKFCDLDKSSDRKLSRHELTQLKAPLVTLERCISPFLDNCDVDGDHYITLPEWGACLHLEEDEIKFKCKKYHNHHN